MHQDALQRAIEICGGQAALAARIGRKQQHIWFWKERAKELPAKVAIEIERATGGQVSRKDLRPDIFGDEAA